MNGSEIIYVTDGSSSGRIAIKGMKDFKLTKQYAEVQISLFMKSVTSIEVMDNDISITGESSVEQGVSVFMIIQDGLLIAPPRILGYGQNPKMFKKADNRLGFVLSNSMCNSALLINNNDMNKCSCLSEPEFKSLRNVRGMVNFIETSYE